MPRLIKKLFPFSNINKTLAFFPSSLVHMAFWENMALMVNGRIVALDWATVFNLHTNEATESSCAWRLHGSYLLGGESFRWHWSLACQYLQTITKIQPDFEPLFLAWLKIKKNIENFILIHFDTCRIEHNFIRTGMIVQQASRYLHPSLILVLHKEKLTPPPLPDIFKKATTTQHENYRGIPNEHVMQWDPMPIPTDLLVPWLPRTNGSI